MKFIEESYSSYTKAIHQIWCRSAKFLWKSKFCSESGSGSGSWYYFGFQCQTYISYMEDTHQILFGSANSFKTYCVHMKSPRTYIHPDRQTDRRTEIFFGLFYLLRHKNHKHLSKGENYTFSFYILRMWWESKKKLKMINDKCKKIKLLSVMNLHVYNYWLRKLLCNYQCLYSRHPPHGEKIIGILCNSVRKVRAWSTIFHL